MQKVNNPIILENNDFIEIRLENDILIGIFKKEIIDIEDAKKNVEYRIKATNGNSYKTIANIMAVKSLTKQARDFFASESGCIGIIATALLTNSPLDNMIGNFYITISKPLRPVKLFTNEAKAKKWLLEFDR